MLTKYYSEKLKRYYDTEDQCVAAELEWDKAHAEEEAKKKARAEAAKHVEDLYKEVAEKKKEADEALREFCKTYGSWHTTVKDAPTSLFDLFWSNWPF